MSICLRLTVVACVVIAGSGAAIAAQEPSAPAADFRLISAKNAEKLQEEIERAAGQGYRVALASPAYDLAILRRVGAGEPIDAYKVLDGKDAVTRGLSEGYGALPDAFDVKNGKPCVVLRKLAVGDPRTSLLLDSRNREDLDKEIRDAASKGFRVVGLASDDAGHAALLERAGADQPHPENAELVALIAEGSQDTLQKALTARAAEGFRITAASAWTKTLLSLERHAEGTPMEFRVLSTTKGSTLEKEMNAAASNGFRFTARTLHAQQVGVVPMFGRSGSAYVAIMEKGPPSDPALDYVIVGRCAAHRNAHQRVRRCRGQGARAGRVDAGFLGPGDTGAVRACEKVTGTCPSVGRTLRVRPASLKGSRHGRHHIGSSALGP